MLNQFYIIPLRKQNGNGDPHDGLCLMQMVDWFSGAERVTDHPKCASPVLGKFAIYLNDNAPSQAKRDELWPLVWRLLGSADDGSEIARAEHIAREVTHRLVAPLFDDGQHGALLRRAQSMLEIQAAARSAAAASWSTESWSAALSAARSAALAAAGSAALAAAESASAASRSASWSAESWSVAAWEISREILIEAIDLGVHGEEDPIFATRAAQLIELV